MLISGNIPLKTQVASVQIAGQIESDNTAGAAAVATVLLVTALLVMVAAVAPPALGASPWLSRRSTAAPAARPGAARLTMRVIVIAYLSLLLVIPVSLIFWRTFSQRRARPSGTPLQDPAMTSTLPRHRHRRRHQRGDRHGLRRRHLAAARPLPLPGRRFLDALIDLPLAVSPVVVGLALILVYGRYGWFGGWLESHGIQVIFALPGMVLATVFVSLPLVVREVMPVLEEIGIEQEQAARTLGAGSGQTFRRITLPAIRWALAYGVVLSLARCLGEFGAVSVVSGHLVNKTQTLPLVVDQSFENFDLTTAYTAVVPARGHRHRRLVVISILRPKERA